jgi:abequosyltransferase
VGTHPLVQKTDAATGGFAAQGRASTDSRRRLATSETAVLRVADVAQTPSAASRGAQEVAHESDPAPRLSVCIATYNRASYIGQTLESILAALPADVEVVVVDGASPDHTRDVVAPMAAAHSRLRYFREATNSGIDRDYDKAVRYARGVHCWLMSDDDLITPGALDRVLMALEPSLDLLLVNAEIRNADLSQQLQPSFMALEGDEEFCADTIADFFAQAGRYLSFIGGVIVRRQFWLQRQTTPYFGTLFIHVGVLLQEPNMASARVIREPLIVIRYGNAMWTARGFEIWMFKWPALVWSFEHVPAGARHAVSVRAPFRSFKRLLWYRAIGGYSSAEYETYLRERLGAVARAVAKSIAWLPGTFANALCSLYYWLRPAKPARMESYDLARSCHSTSLARALARRKGLV